MALPTTTDEWVIDAPSSQAIGLRLREMVPIPALGEDEVLLEIKAVALNFRDIAIARGIYPLPCKYPLVPANDASATILAIGASVTSLSVDDNVIVLPTPLHVSGHLTTATFGALGDGIKPGTLRRHLVVPASWVAHYPDYLTFIEASTIGGAGVTAWNVVARSGLDTIDAVKPGSWVITQGTGGVAMFAAGFAVRLGAVVISTTSSDAKAKHLADLSVHQVLNYVTDPNWGETIRKMSPEGEGVDLVVDVGGTGTLAQSLKAIRYDGTVAVTGFLAGGNNTAAPSLMDVLPRASIVRGVLAGSVEQYKQMIKKMEEWQFHPKIDDKVFQFKDADKAIEYLLSQRHVGKVVIQVNV